MPTLRELLTSQAEVRESLAQIHNEHAEGELPADVQQRWAALETELTSLQAVERRQALLDDADRRATGRPIGGSGRETFEQRAAQVRACDVIRAQMGASDEAAQRARRVSDEIAERRGVRAEGLYCPMTRPVEQRALTLATGSGAALVATDVSQSLVDVLRPRSFVIRAGAAVIDGLEGNLALPKVTASATVAWTPDGSTFPYSNPTLAQTTFSPHHVGGIVSVSRSLVLQSSPAATDIVERDLAALIGTAIDSAAIAGTGVSGQPLGLLGMSGLTLVAGGTNGAALTYSNLVALIGAVDQSNALDGRLAFAVSQKAAKALRTTLKSTGDTSSNFILGPDGTIAGFPAFVSANVPANLTKGTGSNLSAVVFGDWSSLVIGVWSALDILVNPFGTSYASGGVDVRVAATIDVGARHVESFAAITDAIAP